MKPLPALWKVAEVKWLKALWDPPWLSIRRFPLLMCLQLFDEFKEMRLETPSLLGVELALQQAQ
eukprot:scaffold125327_cov17-Tisochrysis_lutea.AAC.1